MVYTLSMNDNDTKTNYAAEKGWSSVRVPDSYASGLDLIAPEYCRNLTARVLWAIDIAKAAASVSRSTPKPSEHTP